MAGAVTSLLPSYFDKFNNHCILIFTDSDNYQQFTVSGTYAVSNHNGVFCRFQNCKHHILLYSEVIDTVVKSLASLTFFQMTVDSLYGIYKHFIAQENFITSEGELMQDIQKALKYNRCHPYMDQRPSVLRKKLIRKTRRLHRRETNNKDIGTQTVARSFNTRIQKILESSYGYDLLQIVDSMIDGNGVVNSPLLSFYVK